MRALRPFEAVVAAEPGAAAGPEGGESSQDTASAAARRGHGTVLMKVLLSRTDNTCAAQRDRQASRRPVWARCSSSVRRAHYL